MDADFREYETRAFGFKQCSGSRGRNRGMGGVYGTRDVLAAPQIRKGVNESANHLFAVGDPSHGTSPVFRHGSIHGVQVIRDGKAEVQKELIECPGCEPSEMSSIHDARARIPRRTRGSRDPPGRVHRRRRFTPHRRLTRGGDRAARSGSVR